MNFRPIRHYVTATFMGNGMISGRKLSPRELLILAFLLLLFIVGCEAAWIAGLREHLRVRQTIVAGTTRRQIEAEFGEPRWSSRPGQPLSEFGWNGRKRTYSPNPSAMFMMPRFLHLSFVSLTSTAP